jgi:hypothetical protein
MEMKMYANQVKMFEEHTAMQLENAMNDWLADHPTEARNIQYIGQNKSGYYGGCVIYQVYTGKRNSEQTDTEKAG